MTNLCQMYHLQLVCSHFLSEVIGTDEARLVTWCLVKRKWKFTHRSHCMNETLQELKDHSSSSTRWLLVGFTQLVSGRQEFHTYALRKAESKTSAKLYSKNLQIHFLSAIEWQISLNIKIQRIKPPYKGVLTLIPMRKSAYGFSLNVSCISPCQTKGSIWFTPLKINSMLSFLYRKMKRKFRKIMASAKPSVMRWFVLVFFLI